MTEYQSNARPMAGTNLHLPRRFTPTLEVVEKCELHSNPRSVALSTDVTVIKYIRIGTRLYAKRVSWSIHNVYGHNCDRKKAMIRAYKDRGVRSPSSLSFVTLRTSPYPLRARSGPAYHPAYRACSSLAPCAPPCPCNAPASRA